MPADHTPPLPEGFADAIIPMQRPANLGNDLPCLRCGGDLTDHILTAGPNGGDDEYRCLVDELSDVIADLETSDPPAEPGWVEVLRHVETAYKRSLIVHEGPVMVGSQFQAPPGSEADRMAVVNDGFVPPFQVDRGPLVRSAWDAQHDAAMSDGSTPRVTTDTAHVFATLRDIADAEPLIYQGDISGITCAMCDAVAPGAGPVPHLISCPWVRATQIVGVKTDG